MKIIKYNPTKHKKQVNKLLNNLWTSIECELAKDCFKNDPVRYVALINKQICGGLTLMIPTRDCIEISLIFTKKEYRRKGVAKELFKIAEKEALKRNKSMVQVFTGPRSPAVKFYEACGMEISGRCSNLDHVGSKDVFLVKVLRGKTY